MIIVRLATTVWAHLFSTLPPFLIAYWFDVWKQIFLFVCNDCDLVNFGNLVYILPFKVSHLCTEGIQSELKSGSCRVAHPLFLILKRVVSFAVLNV